MSKQVEDYILAIRVSSEIDLTKSDPRLVKVYFRTLVERFEFAIEQTIKAKEIEEGHKQL